MERWPFPFLLLLLKGNGEMATSILLSLLFDMWRWLPPSPSLRKGNRGQFGKKKAEIGMATSILTILPQGDGEMTASILTILGRWPPPLVLFFLRGMGRRQSPFYLFSLGNGGMATPFLVEGKERI